MAPELALGYSSAAPLFGGVAAGWSLSLPEIRRDRARGLRDPESDALFVGTAWVSTLHGEERLARFPEPEVPAGNHYRALLDSTFTRYQRVDAAHWLARTLDGMVYRFERLDPSPSPGDRFVLVSTQDRFGNTIRYQWQRGGPDDLPYHDLVGVEYTSNDQVPLGPHARVTFVYDEPVSCGVATPVGAVIEPMASRRGYLRGARPLKTIRTEVRDTPTAAFRPVREVTLTYRGMECSGVTHSPMRQLATLQEAARAPNGTWTSMPPTTFSYGPLDQLPIVRRSKNVTAGGPRDFGNTPDIDESRHSPGETR